MNEINIRYISDAACTVKNLCHAHTATNTDYFRRIDQMQRDHARRRSTILKAIPVLIGPFFNLLRCHNLLLAISDFEKETCAHAKSIMIRTEQDHPHMCTTRIHPLHC
jgi:hypothetical protein